MPNSHHQETHTPTCFHTRIVEDFLGVHDFIPTILTECTLFKKEELRVEVPHLKMLSKSKVMDLLIDAEMPFSEFEAYYKHLQTMQNFDTLVDLSGETLKKLLCPITGYLVFVGVLLAVRHFHIDISVLCSFAVLLYIRVVNIGK